MSRILGDEYARAPCGNARSSIKIICTPANNLGVAIRLRVRMCLSDAIFCRQVSAQSFACVCVCVSMVHTHTHTMLMWRGGGGKEERITQKQVEYHSSCAIKESVEVLVSGT